MLKKTLPLQFTFATLLVMFVTTPSYSQFSRHSFHKLTIEDGLSQSVVQAIVQDKYGFMWFGTNDGLNLYDGYSFKTFRVADGLSEGAIKSLLIANDTLLWVGTKSSGIDILNLKTYQIIKHINTANSKINSNTINDLKLDSLKQIWVATDNGINIISPNLVIKSLFTQPQNGIENICQITIINPQSVWFTKEFSGVFFYNNGIITKYKIRNKLPLKSYDNAIVDAMGNVWVGTNKGLFCKPKNSNEFTQKQIEEENDAHSQVHHLFKDNDGFIWFSVHTQGLYRLNPKTGDFIWYSQNANGSNKFDIISSVSSCIDNAGVIWVGTNGYGVEYFHPKSSFKTISNDESARFRISSNSVRGIAKHATDTNLIWVGSYGGLDLMNKKQGLIRNYNVVDYIKKGMTCDVVYDIYHSTITKQVLIGTEGKGLLILNTNNHSFGWPKHANPDLNMQFELCFKIYPDKQGEVWLGTNNGLHHYNEKTNTITPVFVATEAYEKVRFYDIDDMGNLLLLSSNKGLYVYDKKSKICRNISLNLKNFSEPHIHALTIDKNNIWVTTRGSGLVKFSYNVINAGLLSLTLNKHYTTTNGLPNDVVYGIIKENDNIFWVSTNNGLACINEQNNSISTYNHSDGLQGNEFNGNSYFKDNNGTIYFGGINGLSYFNPQQLHRNNVIPTISFTSFKIFNKTQPHLLNLNETPVLRVPYSSNVLTFTFSSSDFLSNKRIKYAYQLVGFNNEFIHIGNNNSVTFTNLDPGMYELKVIGSNTDGIWNNTGRSLTIKIVPPFWRKKWFAVCLVFLGIALIYLIIKMRTNAIKKANITLEKEVQKRTTELWVKNNELAKAKDIAEKSTNAKSEFLATMSHEIRTPMNGVVGMVSLLENAPLNEEQKSYVDVIRSSTDNLLQVINDILDFSKIESGKLDLHLEPTNIYKVIESSVELFLPRANEKQIELICFVNPNIPQTIIADQIRLKQILYNLINNAIKFTHTGYVLVEVNMLNQNNNEVELEYSVSDTGIGIDAETQSKIFDSFTQADSSTSRKYGGTGLGLSICKSLVTLMQGKLTVQSTEKIGSKFKFTITTKTVETANETITAKSANILLLFKNPIQNNICKTYIEYINTFQASANINVVIAVLPNNISEFIAKHQVNIIYTDNIETLQLINQQNIPNLQTVFFGNAKIQQFIESNILAQKPITLTQIIGLNSHNKAQPETKTIYNDLSLIAKKYPLRILIAEDYLINQTIFKKLFKSLGYEVEIAENGVEALNKVNNNTYDIVFMDVHMPEMDGITATKKIIENHKNKAPVIIALTASVIADEINVYKQAGMRDVLAKPLSLDDAKNCILKWALRLSIS